MAVGSLVHKDRFAAQTSRLDLSSGNILHDVFEI